MNFDEKLNEAKENINNILNDLICDYDPFPFCKIGGCEALSKDCFEHCTSSHLYIYKLKTVNEIDDKLKKVLSKEFYNNLRVNLGYGLGNEAEINMLQFNELKNSNSITLIGSYNEYEIYDLYYKGNFVCKAYCSLVEASHTRDGEFTDTTFYSTFTKL